MSDDSDWSSYHSSYDDEDSSEYSDDIVYTMGRMSLSSNKNYSEDDFMFKHELLEQPRGTLTDIRNSVRRTIETQQQTHLHPQIDVKVSDFVETQSLVLNDEQNNNDVVDEILQMNQASEIIELSIDGTVYKTTRKTILKHDSMIKSMIENKESGGFDIETDNEGRILFHDVPEPQYFKYILMFFRDDGEEIMNHDLGDDSNEDFLSDHAKRKFHTITEDFNIAQLIEFHSLCNFFSVREVVQLIEIKLEKYRMGMDVHTLSEKFYNASEELISLGTQIQEKEKEIQDIDKELYELEKKKRELQTERGKLRQIRGNLVSQSKIITTIEKMRLNIKREVDIVKEESISDLYKINVGGCMFVFTQNDVKKIQNSVLFKLMEHNTGGNVIFIDRDPDLFNLIHAYLKNDKLPENMKDSQRIHLITESKFYGIDELTKQIDCFRYPEEELNATDRIIRDTEMAIRKMFSYDRTNPLLDDSYLLLISVFDNIQLFRPLLQPALDNLLMDFENRNPQFSNIPIIASSKQEFDYHWETITRGLLKGLYYYF